MHVQSVYADHVMLVDCLFVMGIENQYEYLEGSEKWCFTYDLKLCKSFDQRKAAIVFIWISLSLLYLTETIFEFLMEVSRMFWIVTLWFNLPKDQNATA